ncbi:Arc family DNA-binding protein [Rhizobium sp. S-51]|uniref:Arc family DNA-binding protein n=1 Tax=Rhizobium terricola TaxID=2728849 RepID=A0A7Y0FUP1_9HYPH|nr:Arc family DNA-binding protein [Rhizobium terricola]NML73065.1 Arc family DNA-binding protein [Rhizobium terricola]
MTEKKVIQPQDKYVLRLPDGLRARIKAAAEASGRSMNSEIIRLLEDAFGEVGYDETLERYSVELQHLFRGAETSSVEKRLSSIEAKLDQLLALEEHYHAQSESSAARGQAIRKQRSDSTMDHEDGE